MSQASYSTIKADQKGRIAILTINRPDALNALNTQVMTELTDAITKIDREPSIAVTILTGEGRAFAAGADIKEMQKQEFADMYVGDFFGAWDRFAAARKPIIAAVNGFALGGGCELAMMCDIVIASEKAKFGQPEIKLGVSPGMGGSQRLTKLVGKARAMDLILTGRMIDAAEADKIGLVSRVVPHDDLLKVASEIASVIAGFGLPSIMACKEMVQRADEIGVTEGVNIDRRQFHALFGTADQKEGMTAFVNMRSATFTDK